MTNEAVDGLIDLQVPLPFPPDVGAVIEDFLDLQHPSDCALVTLAALQHVVSHGGPQAMKALQDFADQERAHRTRIRQVETMERHATPL